MNNILLIEDSKEVLQLVKLALHGLAQVEWAKNLQAGLAALKEKSFSLVLLDLELPDGNGIELCTKINEAKPELPVFILTASKDLSAKVLGFSAGADDFITKPFESLELRARVEAKLRKMESLHASSDLMRWKEIEIDKKKQEVRIATQDGTEKVELTALEFKLLLCFADRPGVVLSRDELLNTIWGDDVHVYSRSVDTHVSKLRKKLKEAGSTIESVHGTGYKFVAGAAL